MLEKVDLKSTMTKVAYKHETQPLKNKLAMLQQRIKQHKLPVIVLFEGWGASGKGSKISDLILTLDPRSFQVHSIVEPDVVEQRKPPLWRYWNKVPQEGQIAIFDRSWYQDVSVARMEQGIKKKKAYHQMDSINTFERQLTDNGYLLIKFFLHISQKEQKERLDKLDSSKNTSWRVTAKDRKRNHNYDSYYQVFDDMIAYTDTEYAPWHIIPSTDRNFAMTQLYRILVDSISHALAEKEAKQNTLEQTTVSFGDFARRETPKLAEVSLDKVIEPNKYSIELKKAQKTLRKLHNQLYLKKIPVVIVYEGWDAAGKGGNIRRVAAALDPRGYDVVPVAAPDKTELAHHYLWRFWKQLPKTGHIAIFDRSWYGRVMVERIEGFCTEADWHRAFQEINEFEQELSNWGAIVIKFWLHIDSQEQLNRFTDRQNTPEKQWKITQEDWRNREKWAQYEQAVDDLLHYTNTEYAPWHIIESQDKKYARIKALQLLIKAIEDKLKETKE